MKKLVKLVIATVMAVALMTSPSALAQPAQGSVAPHQYSGIVALSNPAVGSMWQVNANRAASTFSGSTGNSAMGSITAGTRITVTGAPRDGRVPIRINNTGTPAWIASASFTNGVLSVVPPLNNCNAQGQCWVQ